MAGPGAALALTALLLTGCGGPADPAPDVDGAAAGQDTAASPAAETAAAEPTGAGESTSDAYPTCDEVKAVLGPAVAGLVALEDSENGVTTGSLGPELGCAWHTPQTAEGSTDLVNYGGIGVGISRDPEYTEDSMGSLGWNIDDPRLAAADAWGLKVGGGYDPAAQLDTTGVQIVRDGVVVVLTSGGVALQDVPELAGLTNEWAIGAGVEVLALTD
jgi:hypothetical protein